MVGGCNPWPSRLPEGVTVAADIFLRCTHYTNCNYGT